MQFLNRKPDVLVGGPIRPFSLRWYIFESRVDRRLRQGLPIRLIDRLLDFNICIHKFLRPDPPGLHDHPWWNISIVLSGFLEEEYSFGYLTEFLSHKTTLKRGMIIFRCAKDAHRLTPIGRTDPITLFITGPTRRDWGYWRRGKWISHRDVG